MATKTNTRITAVQKALHQVKLGKVAPTHALRYVTGHNKALKCSDLLSVANKEGLNPHTVKTQYYGTRAGRFEVPRTLA